MFLIPCACPVTVQETSVGKDILFVIMGGVAHIGATATAHINQGVVAVEVNQLPGHREGLLAAELAEYAANRLQRTVTIVMGIHKDHATPEEIKNIVSSVEEGWKEIIEKIKTVGS